MISTTLVGHDVEHHVVGGSHGVGTYACEVVYALIYVVVYDAFGTCHTLALHREQCRQDSRRYAR